MQFLIAVHQMRSSIDSARNCRQMVDAIKDAGSKGAQFYFAPEMALLLDRNRDRAASQICGEDENPYIPVLQRAAADAGIWVHIGSYAVRLSDGRLGNCALLIDDHGQIRARYFKMHLFDVDLASGESWRESSIYRPGDEAVLAATPLGPMGLTICYDLRFPDLFSRLAQAGAEIFAVPAAFTVPTGQSHWHILLRARAIESASFVVASAQSGDHEDGRRTYGHSVVIDPWGDVILDMGEKEGLGFAEIDLGRISEVRTQIPVHLNRRDVSSVKSFAAAPDDARAKR